MSDQDAEFRRIADAFISVANEQTETAEREVVGMAFLYAASRFNAFVVASHADDLASFDADRQKALDFFIGQYSKMLGENLDDHRKFFDDSLKYAHLMKNN